MYSDAHDHHSIRRATGNPSETPLVQLLRLCSPGVGAAKTFPLFPPFHLLNPAASIPLPLLLSIRTLSLSRSLSSAIRRSSIGRGRQTLGIPLMERRSTRVRLDASLQREKFIFPSFFFQEFIFGKLGEKHARRSSLNIAPMT